MSQIIVRFAPSPTGFLHVGGLRTALFNFLFARKNRGQFILRIEDTDKAREVKGAVENIVETLKTFGLNFDEGPIFQSQRLPIYKQHIEALLNQGAAYKCYCSGERIAELKKQAELLQQPFRYDKYCLRHPDQTGENFVVRQNVPEEEATAFHDEVYGEIKIDNRLLDDGVLMKSDGWPVYNFANVVDDHLMGVTHVIRGEEFISSTPKHILLYKAFGWAPPHFVHLPLLLDKKRQKLSKRSGDVAVKEYLDKGYLPEAILNFIALLGWNPKTEQEFFTPAELIAAFDLAKINRAGAIFDLEKLQWFNNHYQRQKSLVELLNLITATQTITGKARIIKRDLEFDKEIIALERERAKTLKDLADKLQQAYQIPDYEPKLLIWKNMTSAEVVKSLQRAQEILAGIRTKPVKDELQQLFFAEIGERDKGEMLWPLRVALTGLAASPSPFEILAALFKKSDGPKIIHDRLQQAIEKLG